ncbi:MAG: hypothetical protein M0Q91_12670 [Methanoregula sp.]|jgi:hypothetical protein|nr:hypothetical protein [Methanoregula sp.]
MTNKCPYLNDASIHQPPCLADKDEDCPKRVLKGRISPRCWRIKERVNVGKMK